MALRIQGLSLRRPQTTGRGTVSKEVWFGETDVKITSFCISLRLLGCMPFFSLFPWLCFECIKEIELIFNLRSGTLGSTQGLKPWN